MSPADNRQNGPLTGIRVLDVSRDPIELSETPVSYRLAPPTLPNRT
jgi:hypothetical protein